MGNLRILLLLLLLTTTLATSNFPPRPTRTLGSLFGSSKPSAAATQPIQQKIVQNTQQQTHQNGIRPLVYQVKYYERNNNHVPVVDYPDSRNYVVDNSKLGADLQFVNPQVLQTQPTTNRLIYYNPLIPPPQPLQNQILPEQYLFQNPYHLPCSHGNDHLIYENNFVPSTSVAMNLSPPQQQIVDGSKVVPSTIRAPVGQELQAQQQQQQQGQGIRYQQPLVREQVVQAAAELSGGVPGSGVVGAGINSVPYGYYYYYYIPPLPQQQYYRIPAAVQPQSQYIPSYVLNPYSNPVATQLPKIIQQPQNLVPVQTQQQTQRVVPVTVQNNQQQGQQQVKTEAH